MQQVQKRNTKIRIAGWLTTAILAAVFILSQWIYTQFDATEERRYTITPATRELLKEVEDRIYIKILLDGNFPASFERLRESTEDMVRRFSQVNPQIEYNFENPNVGSTEQINATRKQLADNGIIPTQLRVSDGAQASTQYIYPYAIIHFGSRSVPVSLLQDDIPGADKELIINNSIALLEYKLAAGIQKVQQHSKRLIAFTTGQGELTTQQTTSMQRLLSDNYDVVRIDLDSTAYIPEEIKALIIAKPTKEFSEAKLFMLDQFIMKGGHVAFLIDPLVVSLDSIDYSKNYIPYPYPLGLDPLFFKLGARLQPNLVLDLQCTRIPLVVGMQGDKVQTELYPWYYYPLISITSDHPITKGLDRIQLEFPATIDTLQTATPVEKTILLRSSEYSRIQLTPVRLNFNILREPPDPALFDKGPQSVAVMLEGKFESMFANRLALEQLEFLKQKGIEFVREGDQSRVMIVADGDIVRNLINSSTGDVVPLGYNKYENTTFTGNRDFLLNAMEYMMDDAGVLEARAKDIKLRLLDTVRAQKEITFWQVLNIVVPVVLIIVAGVLVQYFRKRKFGTAA